MPDTLGIRHPATFVRYVDIGNEVLAASLVRVEAFGETKRRHWRYLEHDWVAKPGTFMYEPAGEAHTLVITEDSPEPALIMFVVEGGLIYLDKRANGNLAAYEDGFTALELTRKYYREAGLDARKLDLLVR